MSSSIRRPERMSEFHIQVRFQGDAVPGKTPLPRQCPIVGSPVTPHLDHLLRANRAKRPDVIQTRAKTHDNTVMIAQIRRGIGCSVAGQDTPARQPPPDAHVPANVHGVSCPRQTQPLRQCQNLARRHLHGHRTKAVRPLYSCVLRESWRWCRQQACGQNRSAQRHELARTKSAPHAEYDFCRCPLHLIHFEVDSGLT